MVAVTAETAAALANRLRALLSWVTNSLCLETNGEMSASDGPGVDPDQLGLGRGRHGGQLPQ